MKRAYPHGEDYDNTAGGDTSEIRKAHNRPIAFNAGPPMGQSPASPPGEGKYTVAPRNDEIENQASEAGLPDDENQAQSTDFLLLVREAETQAARYVAQVNRRAWSQSMRAFNNEHYLGSKYTTTDYRNRSKIFRPKTRSAVRKDMAAVAASLFANIDAINCLAGNEGDIRQRGAAAVMEELINYRTDRSSGKASLPWFAVAMGSRQDALVTGICLSKQSWKLELREDDKAQPSPDGTKTWVIDVDRPDSQLIPPENVVIDPSADWTNPIQSASYVIIKWPMQLQEIQRLQRNPIRPWKKVSASQLLANSDAGTTDTSAIRRARELGIDRYDETQTGRKFQIVWVYEVFMRVDGVDYTFWSCGDRAYLTDPEPTRKVYPEQFGERPLTFGLGHLDAHRLFPMSPVESWQQYQMELNEIANLTLDATKQNVMPISKIRRGRQVDLDQVKKRSSGSSIMVQEPDDVTWETPPSFPPQVAEVTRELELEMDDLAGQFNGQTAENNNALSRTLGGLKLVSGSANSLQEFDIRVWIETWAAPTLAQIVRLEQYYEHDDVILGICGDRAGLMKKYGINTIDDSLLEQEIVVRVSVGLGAGDPQQRLMKFSNATQIVLPILQSSPEFASGARTIDVDAVCDEVFGAAGYRDGGARFFKAGQPHQDPMMPLKMDELRGKIEKDKKTGNAALLTALSAAAKAALGNRQLESELAEKIARLQLDAADMGAQHAHQHVDTMLKAADHGHRHAMAIRGQTHQESQPSLGDAFGGAGPPSAPGGEGSTGTPSPGGQPQGQPQPQGAPPQQGGQPQGQPPGAPQGQQPQGAPPPENGPPEPSVLTRLASHEPGPQPNEPPKPGQQEIDAARQASAAAEQSQGAPPPQAANPEHAALLKHLADLTEAMKRPRQAVRDKSGRIVGLV